MILKKPVYIESTGEAPVDGYLARDGSLRPLTLHLDPLDDTGLPAASPLIDEATRVAQSIAATIARAVQSVEAAAPFASQDKLIAAAPADVERFRRDAAELDRQRALFPQPPS